MKDFSKIDALIYGFVEKVIKEPLVFFSEYDLQSILYGTLTEKFNKNYSTSYRRGFDAKTYYKTSQIHREYGINDMPNSRMDLVLFDKESIKKIDSPNLTENKKYIIPIIGFELGTHKINEFETHLKNDISKLQKLKRGYIIYIMRDETLSAPFTETGKKTEEWFQTNIEMPLTKVDFPTNIIPLVFYIKIQKHSTNLYGKCNFYKPREKKFEKVNLKNIKTTLCNYYK